MFDHTSCGQQLILLKSHLSSRMAWLDTIFWAGKYPSCSIHAKCFRFSAKYFGIIVSKKYVIQDDLSFGRQASWVSGSLGHQATWALDKQSKHDGVKITFQSKVFKFSYICFPISSLELDTSSVGISVDSSLSTILVQIQLKSKSFFISSLLVISFGFNFVRIVTLTKLI